jgi:tRNA threonylcarbamoyladenosine biosynthesis protein TsaE
VRGAVTSPTFVIARVHPSSGDGPALVHADAYRIADLAEVDDLDLDASMDESVTVVEWGEGKVEGLSADRLEVVLHRGSDEADESRIATIRPVGRRWVSVDVWPRRPAEVRPGPDLIRTLRSRSGTRRRRPGSGR